MMASNTFKDYALDPQETKSVKLCSTSPSFYYKNYLSWLATKHPTSRFTAAQILFQLKIINDLVIFNLKAPEETLVSERQQIIARQPDSTLLPKLNEALENKIPDPTLKKLRKRYILIQCSSIVLGAGLLLCASVLPQLLLLPAIVLGLNMMMLPVTALCFARSQYIRKIKPTNQSIEKLAFASTISIGYLILFSTLLIGTGPLIQALAIIASFMTAFSLSALTISSIRQPLYEHHMATMKTLPSLLTKLTHLIAPKPEDQTPELKQEIKTTLLVFKSLQGCNVLNNGVNFSDTLYHHYKIVKDNTKMDDPTVVNPKAYSRISFF